MKAFSSSFVIFCVHLEPPPQRMQGRAARGKQITRQFRFSCLAPAAGAGANCANLPNKRMYPGNSFSVDLPYYGPVTYDLGVGLSFRSLAF